MKDRMPKLRDVFSFTLTRGDDSKSDQDAAVDALLPNKDTEIAIGMAALLRVRVNTSISDEQAFLITKMFSEPLAMDPSSVAKMVLDFHRPD